MSKDTKHINECSCGCGGTCSTNEAYFKKLPSGKKVKGILNPFDYDGEQFGKFIVNKIEGEYTVHKGTTATPPIKTFGKSKKAEKDAISYAKKRAGVNESTDSNNNVKVLKNIYKNHTDKTEHGFYDQLDKIETKMGNQKYRSWLSKIADALDIKYRTHADLEEKLFHIAAGHNKVHEKKKLSENMIDNLISHMQQTKLQRKVVRIKSEQGFQKFMKDAKSAIASKRLIVKRNPIDKDELWISLGPKSQISEHSQTFDVDEAGQLWPFAEKKSYATSWESARMSNLFKGSLKDMMVVGTSELSSITNDSDQEDYRRLKRGGDSYDTYDMPKHVLGDYSVQKIMYDKGEVDRYADDVPTPHLEETKK